MFDLTAISVAPAAGLVAGLPPGEAREPQISGDAFANLLGIQLGAATKAEAIQPGATGKDLPPAGNALPQDADTADGDAETDNVEVIEGETEVGPASEIGPQPAALSPVVSLPGLALTQPQAHREGPGIGPSERPMAEEQLPSAQPAEPVKLASERPAKMGVASPNLAFVTAERPAGLPNELPRVRPDDLPRFAGRDVSGAVEANRTAGGSLEPAPTAAQRAVAVQAVLATGMAPAKVLQAQPAGAAHSAQPETPRLAAVSLPERAPSGHSAQVEPNGQGAEKTKPEAAQTLTPRQSPAPPATAEPQLAQAIAPAAAAGPGEARPTGSTVPVPLRTDFGAIVDRLIEARDAAGAQPIKLALDHAQFGRVSLDFRPADSGLSVAMTSPDPDFARAANAALSTVALPDQPAPQGESGQPRRDTAHSAFSDSSGQRGAAPERRGKDPRQRQATAHHQPEPGRPRRSGIFA